MTSPYQIWILGSQYPLANKGEFMSSFKRNDEGFTGLEAAIVLIAFVVVAAVFSYVVLGAGFFTTQKAQETVYTGVAQATSNIQMVGQVYGTTSTTGGTQIKNIQFTLGLAPGAPAMDLTKLIIVVTQPGTSSINQLTWITGDSTAATASRFTTNGVGVTLSPAGTLKTQQQAAINFQLNPMLQKNGQVNIELRPAVGASLPFTRSAPASITDSQIIY